MKFNIRNLHKLFFRNQVCFFLPSINRREKQDLISYITFKYIKKKINKTIFKLFLKLLHFN